MKPFLKQVLSSCLGTLIALSLLSTLSFVSLVALIAVFSKQDSGHKVKDESILIFDTGVIIQDRDPSSSVGDVISGNLPNVISLRDVTESIRAAAKDSKIVGMLMDGRNDNSNGYASLKEVRQALQEFKKAGKKIYAYDVDMTEREYYLNSLADEIWLNPSGGLEINGFGTEQPFFKKALDKYGIGVQIVRVGSFKGAVEPFTRPNFSPENRLQTQAFLDDFWTDFKNTTTGDRALAANTIQNIANTQGMIKPKVAKNAKLVTHLGYFDEILDTLKGFTGTKKDDTIPQIDLAAYRDNLDLKNVGNFSKNKIAIVYAEGEIVGGEGAPNSIGGDSLSRELRELRYDKDIKVIVLRINSPGGSATAADIILRELKLIRSEAKKPIIVSMGDVAASGGYWIATESDRIFAENNTITGSIGVFGILPNVQKIANDHGVTWDGVKTGELANLSTNSRPKNPKELAIFQGFVNEVYDNFLERVSKSRGLTKQQVNTIAQGRVWSGEDAKNIKLVDEIGGLKEAIAYAAKKANLGDDFAVDEYPLKQTWEEEIFKNLFDAKVQQPNDVVTQEWLKFQESVAVWRSLNDPKQVYAIFPWQFTID